MFAGFALSGDGVLFNRASAALLDRVLALHRAGRPAAPLLAALQRLARLAPGTLSRRLPALALLSFLAPPTDVNALNALTHRCLTAAAAAADDIEAQATASTGGSAGGGSKAAVALPEADAALLSLGALQQAALGCGPGARAWGAHLLTALQSVQSSYASDCCSGGDAALPGAAAADNAATAPRGALALLRAAQRLLRSFWDKNGGDDTAPMAASAAANPPGASAAEAPPGNRPAAAPAGGEAAAVRWLASLRTWLRLERQRHRAARAGSASAFSVPLQAAQKAGRLAGAGGDGAEREELEPVSALALAALLSHPSYEVR